MSSNPLSDFVASPFSHAARGKGDAARAAGRPLHGGRWLGTRQFYAVPARSTTVDSKDFS